MNFFFEVLGMAYTAILIVLGVWLGIVRWCERRREKMREKYTFHGIDWCGAPLRPDEISYLNVNCEEITQLEYERRVFEDLVRGSAKSFCKDLRNSLAPAPAKTSAAAVDKLIRPVERGDRP